MRFTLALVATCAFVSTGCNQGGSSRSSASTAAPVTSAAAATPATSTTTLTGTARYEKRLPDPATNGFRPEPFLAPVPGALVEAVAPDGRVLARGATGERGAFTLTVSAVTSGTFVRLSAEAADGSIEVRTPSGETPQAISFVKDGQPVDLVVPVARGRIAGAFNVLATTRTGLAHARSLDPGFAPPTLRVQWSPKDGVGPRWSASKNLLFIEDAGDTSDMDDSVVLHELGHFIQTALGVSWSPGGQHLAPGMGAPPQDLDPRLAFGEAWATFFAQSVLRDPTYVDTGLQTVDLEAPPFDVKGPGSENAVLALLWDLLDGPGGLASRDPETVAIPERVLWDAHRALANVSHAHIGDFASALERSVGAVDRTAWNAAFGPLGLQLPIADLGTPLPPNQVREGTVNASLQQDTLRVANAYYTVTLAKAGSIAVAMRQADPVGSQLLLLVTQPDGVTWLGGPTASDDGVVVLGPGAPPGEYLVRVVASAEVPGSPRAAFTIRAEVR